MDIHRLYAVSYVFDQVGLTGMLVHKSAMELPKRRPWRAIIKLTRDDFYALKAQAWILANRTGHSYPGDYFIYAGIRYEAMTHDEETGVEAPDEDTQGT